MESQRSFVLIALVFVSYLLFSQWEKDYGPQPQPVAQQSQRSETPAGNSAPTSDIPTSDVAAAAASAEQPTRQMISVKTDVLSVLIDPVGGTIVGGDLLKYPIEQHQDEPVHLLSNDNQAISGLLGIADSSGKLNNMLPFSAKKTEYTANGNEPLNIPLTWSNAKGLVVTKTFTFKPDAYDIQVSYQITNNGSTVQPVQQYAELKKQITAPKTRMGMASYNEATYSTAEERYEKYKLKDMKEKALLRTTVGGWVAMQEHYFVSAWVPGAEDENKIYSRVSKDDRAIIGFRGPVHNIQPGSSQSFSATLYAGPKVQKDMAAISPTLKLTVDYGPLWFISQLLFSLLLLLHSFVGNWGFSIILITVIVKTFMYPLTKKQTVSMAKMRNLQPKLMALKEKYGDDKQKMGPAMMELYRKEKVNPLGGCLPLLLQMPIFLSLYWMLMESVELRHGEFILWITDLSTKDPYFVLPALYGISMFLMQKITPTPTTDPMQQKVMMWMPVVFSLLFMFFPAGLVLYWLVNNVISISQMLYIYRQIDKKGLAGSPANAAK